MKRLLISILITGFCIHGFARLSEYNILDFGAVGDSVTMNTSSIQRAIDKCWKSGGGRVVVPAGVFYSSGFELKSNVDFHLEEGAVILGSPYTKDYERKYLLHEARYSKNLGRALVFAQGAKNITVSGKGTLNGNGLLGSSLGEFLVGEEYCTQRPCLLWFDECQNIVVKDITYTNSAMWTETYSRCKNIHVNGITVIDNYNANADGCNMVDCEDFIIENCNINAQDDGICLKSFTNQGCKGGIIRNNKVRSICNGIKMGTDSSGGFSDISIENNEVWQTGIAGLALEIVDGGTMENISVENIKMHVIATPILIILSQRYRKIYGDITIPKGIIRNIRIKGIEAVVDRYEVYNELERQFFDHYPHASSITGFPGRYVEDVIIEDVNITIRGYYPQRTCEDALREIPEAGAKYPENNVFGVLPAHGFYVRHVRGLKMRNINIKMKQEDGRAAFTLDDVLDSEFKGIKLESVSNTPAFSIEKNCSGIQVD